MRPSDLLLLLEVPERDFQLLPRFSLRHSASAQSHVPSLLWRERRVVVGMLGADADAQTVQPDETIAAPFQFGPLRHHFQPKFPDAIFASGDCGRAAAMGIYFAHRSRSRA